ncbi:MAG: penicillin-binding protein activator, partial [Gammaproteobacteria bacterium]|nr:penicillin-binding protein activator [Gammaproteobacteria bacterium]
ELAMAKGADFIIGPLDRENARQLVNQVMPSIPVLLLNKIERSASDDIFQFGLDPETEVQQVADQAALENFSHALAIVPDDQWGERHIKAFKEYWEEKGRTLVDTIHYLPTDNFEKIIGKTLGIDESEQRARQISRMLRTPVQANPRRRQDIDFVFLLAPTTDAIKLRPSLSLHYAEDIPMYSTSYIYDSTERKVNQMDLSNIRFCDIPLKLQGYNEFQKQLLQNWPATKGPLARFYAMGADAYLLQQRIRQMQTIPQLRVYGATGILSLDNDNTLDRQLTWAYFSQGQAKPMPVLMGGFDRNP